MPRVPIGYRVYQKVVVAARFSPDCFEQIRKLAAKRGVTISEQIRSLVEIGLIVEEEIEAEQ